MTDYSNLRNQVLSIRIISALSQPLRRRFPAVELPSLLVVVLLESVIGVLEVVIWKIAGIQVTLATNLWAYWGCLLSGICLILVESNLDQFLQTMRQYAGHVFGPEQSAFARWANKAFNLRRQILFSLISTAIIFPTAFPFFAITMGFEARLWTAPVLFINLFFIGNALYWIIVLPGAARLISRHAQRIGAFAPRNIIWIDKLSDVYQRAALSTSLVGVALIIPVALGPKGSLPILVVTSGWLLLVWTLVLIPYVLAQSHLSEFVSRERLLTLTETQTKIYELMIRDKESNNSDQAETLLKIYKEAQEAEGSVWGFQSSLKFINSLLLPSLSFILLSFPQILDTIQQLVRLTP